MRLWLKRYRLHFRLVAIIGGGVAAGLVATAWIPAAWAGTLGAATTAIVTATVLGAQAELQRRSDSVRRLPAALEVLSKGNGFPLVRNLSNPVSVGVHPAEAIEVDGIINRVPFYITREMEPELHAALRRAGFVLIVGESTAGKTRMAFEAMQLFLGDRHFVAPSSREALSELLSQLTESGDYVIWLDDLERFLGTGGLTLSVLHRLLAAPGRIVILATMRSHEHERYRDRVEGELNGAERDVWREGRAVLRQAEVVHLDRLWTAKEQSRAQAHVADRRLAHALASADRFGIAETLAAGPELAEAWRHAWTPGQHPRGAALVAAAVGARRVGFQHPLPLHVLEEMHTAHLEERGGPELRPEPMTEAVRWASTPTFPNGANSLLIGTTESGYLAFDYLIDLPGSSSMPDPSWSALIESASGQEAYIIGQYAQAEGRYDRVIMALRRAADTGNAPAEALLADIGAPIRSAPESLERAIQYLGNIQRELGPDHEDSIEAEQAVLVFTMQDGRYRDALALATDLADRGANVLGAKHRMVLGIRYSIAVCIFRLGDLENGMSQLDSVIDESARTLGRLAAPVSYRRISRVNLLAEAGRIAAARERLDELQADCSNFPRDHLIMAEIEKAAGHIIEMNRQVKS